MDEVNCDHDFETGEPYHETGKNLIGDRVTAYVVDLKCVLCDTESVRIIQADTKYAK